MEGIHLNKLYTHNCEGEWDKNALLLKVLRGCLNNLVPKGILL